MTNIHDYLYSYGNLTKEQAPLNEVDALILAKLSYLPFEMASSQEEFAPISIRDAAFSLLLQPDLNQHLHFKDDREFLREVAESKRFRNMKVSHYVNRIEEENQTQFSALTIPVDNQMNFVVFRGTDSSLTGWKENFNMSFTFPVPAQKSALKYLEEISAGMEGSFILCGHSKGGNLAMFAAAFCCEAVQNRILAIYNFDGPGFDAKALATPQYQGICSRITTFVPQSSIVGMLFEHEEKFVIVRSKQPWFMQHDMSAWEVERDHLCRVDQRTYISLFFDRTMKGWLADMDTAQREKFVDALYSILVKMQAHSLKELNEWGIERIIEMFLTVHTLDENTKKLIRKTLSLLFKSAGNAL